jgi:hypothetical protein
MSALFQACRLLKIRRTVPKPRARPSGFLRVIALCKLRVRRSPLEPPEQPFGAFTRGGAGEVRRLPYTCMEKPLEI